MLFSLVTVTALTILWRSSGRSRTVIIISAGWILIQSVTAVSGFYMITDTIPPRFILLIAPPALFILWSFLSSGGKRSAERFDGEWLTYLHTTRIGIEIVLFLLSGIQFVPTMLTWEGSNLDILTGITAPVIGYFGYRKKRLSNQMIIGWNLAGMILLFNVVYHGILSAPSPFQQFSFDRPNLLPLYFPFMLLPGFLVPLMLYSHLVSVRLLLRR